MNHKNIPKNIHPIRLVGLLLVMSLPAFAGQSMDSERIFDQIFADRFDSCSLQNWSGWTNLSDANVGHQGQSNRRYSGICGLRIPTDSEARYLYDDKPSAEASINFRFYVNFDAYGDEVLHFVDAGGPFSRLQLRYNDPAKGFITLRVLNNAGVFHYISHGDIGAGWHSIEVFWEASGSALVGFSVNGGGDATVEVDNSEHEINTVVIGNLHGNAATSGFVDIDAYDARRITRPGRVLVGDANDDGVIDQYDVDAVMDEVNGIAFATGQPDCNEDGEVDMLDVFCIEALFESQGELIIEPAQIDFGEVEAGVQSSMDFTVSNDGGDDGSLTLYAIDLLGDSPFSISGGSCSVGDELSPGSDCTVTVTYAPTSAGNHSAHVQVTSADVQSVAGLVTGRAISGGSEPVPPQFPSITVDDLFRDGFELGPENLYPRIEFTSDSMLLFEGAGVTRSIGVRVFDADGNVMPDTSVTWQSSDSAVQVSPTGELTAAVESQSSWSEPVRITVQHPGLGISAQATAVMGGLASSGAPLDRVGRGSEVVVIPSNWVSAVFGNRLNDHVVRLHSTSITELIQAGDIVVSGNYAGLLVRVLEVASVGSGEIELTVQPAAITDAFESLKLAAEGEPLEVTMEASPAFSTVSIRSLRDDVSLYHRSWPDARILAGLECSGGLDPNLHVSFDEPLTIQRTIKPYVALDIDGFSVDLWEMGVEGSLTVSTAISANLNAGVSYNGSCELNWNLALPGISLLFLDIGPNFKPAVGLSLHGSAQASAGWVPVSGLQRSWTLDAGVRYIGGQGWTTFTDYDSQGGASQAPQFAIDGQLQLEAELYGSLGLGLAFCVGICSRFTKIADVEFLEVRGGPYWRFDVSAPVSSDHVNYGGAAMDIGVGAMASVGIQASFFDSGILSFIPVSGSGGISVPIFSESFSFHQAPHLSGGLSCSPNCNNVPETGGSLNLQLTADTDSTGTASFWLRQGSASTLTHLTDASFSGQSAQATYSLPSNLTVGDYEVYPRLELDSALYWFTGIIPLGSTQPIGEFTVVEDGTPPPPPPAAGLLNDTGIDWCANNDTNFLDCPVGSHPGQDGDHGRDALARQGLLNKVGAGAAGFDYTKLDASGNELPASAPSWSCVRDNHTGLTWEVKLEQSGHPRDKDERYEWDYARVDYPSLVNIEDLCGISDWRLPSQSELLSLVNYGQAFLAIDESYFPHTESSRYWTSRRRVTNDFQASWSIHFATGSSSSQSPSVELAVRAVSGENYP